MRFIKAWIRHQHPNNFYKTKWGAFLGGLTTAYVLGVVVPEAWEEYRSTRS